MRVLAQIDDTYDYGQVFGCYKIDDFKGYIISKIIEYDDIWCSDYLNLKLFKTNHILMTKRFSLEEFDYSDIAFEKLGVFLDSVEKEFQSVKEQFKD